MKKFIIITLILFLPLSTELDLNFLNLDISSKALADKKAEKTAEKAAKSEAKSAEKAAKSKAKSAEKAAKSKAKAAEIIVKELTKPPVPSVNVIEVNFGEVIEHPFENVTEYQYLFHKHQ